MKILIIRPAALGDTLMLVPALDQMRHFASICVAGRKPGLDYLGHLASPCLDFEAEGWHTLFTDTPEVPTLPGVDLALAFLRDPEGIVKGNLYALFPGARVRLFPGLPAPGDEVHVAFYLARCLQAAGVDVDPRKSIQEALSRPLIEGNGLSRRESGIVLHPGSGGREKNHPPDFWMEVVSRLRIEPSSRDKGVTVLLGPAEESLYPFFDRRIKGSGGEILVAPEPRELVSLLSRTEIYLGQDSGITHLAAMLGTPTIALFRHSSVNQWRPLGPRVTVIDNHEPDVALTSCVLEQAGVLLRKDDEAGLTDR